MKKLQSKYPLGQLLISIVTGSGLRLPVFVRAIGYRNVNKGIRALHSFLATGFGNTVFIERLLASHYAPNKDAFELIAQQHVEQIEQEICLARKIELDERRLSFQPFVHAIPALNGSTSLTLFALSGGFRPYNVTLPAQLSKRREKEQFQHVGSVVRENFQATEGQIRFLGPIRYYLYFHSWDAPPVAFSTEGEALGIADGAAVPAVEFRIGSRLVSLELLEKMLHSAHGEVLH